MPSHLHTRGQLTAYASSPDEGTVEFEGPEFERFARDLQRKLQDLVERWAPQSAPVRRPDQPDRSHS